MSKKYKDMTPEEQGRFLDAMNKVEGGKVGTVTAGTGKLTPGNMTVASSGTVTTPAAARDTSGRATAATDPRVAGNQPPAGNQPVAATTQTTSLPAVDAMQTFVSKGLLPATTALQDLVSKGLQPLTAALADKNANKTGTGSTAQNNSPNSSQASGGKPKEATLNDVVAGLTDLNTNMSQLIKATKQTVDLNSDQLRVQKGLSNNLYT